MTRVRFGFIGAGFMGKAHSQACRALKACFPDFPVQVELTTIAAASAATAEAAAERFGFASFERDWRDVIARDDVDAVSVLVANRFHHEIVLAAAAAGKHILCEKPMAMSVVEAEEMTAAAERADVRTMLCFNYRRTPAVLYAQELLASGAFGQPYAFRGVYLQDWLADPGIASNWRLRQDLAGSGTLGDITSHVIDFAQFLLGDIERVNGLMRTWVGERPAPDGDGRVKVDVDDEVMCLLEFANGAIGSIQATRFAPGRKNFLGFEVNCEGGSLIFDYERMNELWISRGHAGTQGFERVVIGPDHPYGKRFWPIPGIGVGFHEIKMIEIHDFVRSVATGENARPDFADGVQNQRVLHALEVSAATGSWQRVPS
jgi:predicted dehydrogenase